MVFESKLHSSLFNEGAARQSGKEMPTHETVPANAGSQLSWRIVEESFSRLVARVLPLATGLLQSLITLPGVSSTK